MGYRCFGRYLPHQHECRLPQALGELFPPDATARRILDRTFVLYRQEFALIRQILGAVLVADVDRFHEGLERLHPHHAGRLPCIILLSRFARHVHQTHQERTAGRGQIQTNGRTHLWDLQMKTIADSFSASQSERLWQRFAAVDAMQRGSEAVHVNGFLRPPTDYFFEQLPPTVSAERVIEALLVAPQPAR